MSRPPSYTLGWSNLVAWGACQSLAPTPGKHYRLAGACQPLGRKSCHHGSGACNLSTTGSGTPPVVPQTSSSNVCTTQLNSRLHCEMNRLAHSRWMAQGWLCCHYLGCRTFRPVLERELTPWTPCTTHQVLDWRCSGHRQWFSSICCSFTGTGRTVYKNQSY